jgi:hypothetical protein
MIRWLTASCFQLAVINASQEGVQSCDEPAKVRLGDIVSRIFEDDYLQVP